MNDKMNNLNVTTSATGSGSALTHVHSIGQGQELKCPTIGCDGSGHVTGKSTHVYPHDELPGIQGEGLKGVYIDVRSPTRRRESVAVCHLKLVKLALVSEFEGDA